MKRMNRFMTLGLVLGLVFLAAPMVQAASIPAVTFIGNSSPTSVFQAETVGWRFTVTGNSILVTDLGVFDSDLNGLANRHEVGIWDTSGTLLVSDTVFAGTSGTLLNQFRYVDTIDTLLGPGTYTIGASWRPAPGDDYTASAYLSTFQAGPGITYLDDRYSAGAPNPIFEMPTITVGGSFDPAIFGPNFQYSAVPEPGTMMLLGSGLVGLAGWGRKKFRK